MLEDQLRHQADQRRSRLPGSSGHAGAPIGAVRMAASEQIHLLWLVPSIAAGYPLA